MGDGRPPGAIDTLLAEARSAFAASLPAKTAALADVVGRAAWNEARRAAHKLRGSAGTYGFGALGAAVGHIEDILIEARGAPDASAAARIATLVAEARQEAASAATGAR